jgi:hypothetical protein
MHEGGAKEAKGAEGVRVNCQVLSKVPHSDFKKGLFCMKMGRFKAMKYKLNI